MGGEDSRSIRASVSGNWQSELESVGEDGDGPFACLVCKEGYATNPTELLAAYCFCKKVHVSDAGGAAPLEAGVADQVGFG